MHRSTLILDGCGYAREDGRAEQPDGGVVEFVQLKFVVPGDDGSELLVLVRFKDEEFKEFLKNVGQAPVQTATVADLQKLMNGGR